MKYKIIFLFLTFMCTNIFSFNIENNISIDSKKIKTVKSIHYIGNMLLDSQTINFNLFGKINSIFSKKDGVKLFKYKNNKLFETVSTKYGKTYLKYKNHHLNTKTYITQNGRKKIEHFYYTKNDSLKLISSKIGTQKEEKSFEYKNNKKIITYFVNKKISSKTIHYFSKNKDIKKTETIYFTSKGKRKEITIYKYKNNKLKKEIVKGFNETQQTEFFYKKGLITKIVYSKNNKIKLTKIIKYKNNFPIKISSSAGETIHFKYTWRHG